MNAIKFVDAQGSSVWTKELTDGRTQTSVCVEVNDETLDLSTGYMREEKSLVWIKAMSTEVATRQQKAVIEMVNNGTLKPFRAFSKTPFYEGQTEDINPTTKVALGRYSQVRLCPADQHSVLHRQYVVLDAKTTNDKTKDKPQPKVNLEA